MTLNELRERLKATMEAADGKWSTFGGSSMPRMNMRQKFLQVAQIVEPMLSLPSDVRPSHEVLAFYRAGMIYYHAKKHGLQSAMLFKLQITY